MIFISVIPIETPWINVRTVSQKTANHKVLSVSMLLTVLNNPLRAHLTAIRNALLSHSALSCSFTGYIRENGYTLLVSP